MRAEVGLLRRRGDAPAITIRGVDHNQPQYRFRAMHLEMAGVFLEVHEAEQARKDACDAHMWRELLVEDGFLSAATADVVFNRTAGGDLGLMELDVWRQAARQCRRRAVARALWIATAAASR